MNAVVMDEDGRPAHPAMGCYGIGVSRIVAAAIEQNHDDAGIIWPEPMAPFTVAVLPINGHKSHRAREQAERFYEALMKAGVEDRKSTRLNSSHVAISYAVFCLKKKQRTPER